MRPGDLVEWGGLGWRVLEANQERALLLTDQMVDQRDYHRAKEDVTWETSEIRRYLNHAFLERFSARDRDQILTTVNVNPGNPWYHTDGGPPTEDRIFLLSLDEVVRCYFGDSSRLLDHPKANQRYWFDRKDENNPLRKAQYLDSSWWWWTRTPGKNHRVAVYVHGDGNIGIQGNGVSKTTFNTLHPQTGRNEGGVRPALWVQVGTDFP